MSRTITVPQTPLPLINGERLGQAEFHRRYSAYPSDVKFELIGGIVHMASPLGWAHAFYHPKLSYALEHYAASTPGVVVGDNATTILNEESEPQPDLQLRIQAENGGRTRLNLGKYVQGPPELVAEIAHSSRDVDLHEKREDYAQSGVLEYIVVCVEEHEIHWFHFASDRPIAANRQGIYRSREFPGLWIDGSALFEGNVRQLAATLDKGLARRDHASFVRRLEARRTI